eukprot:snap_masked-scaffold_1-processed-gene-11.15-mRNA-1 protein AED:0.05 eAED:0.05 QI:0/-1/0/1/-1/1/1/0/494
MEAESYLQDKKYVTDAVHDSFQLPKIHWKIIDTPEFQRLRSLKQLGSASYIFPSAVHTRFEHSLGVSHLSLELLLKLRNEQPELNITPVDILCVSIAALCHDLGHGPFSHLFDNLFIKNDKWCHEKGSILILRQLLKENNIELLNIPGFEPKDIIFIEECILGGNPKKGRSSDKVWLYEVVNNERSGLDLDKLDYLLRDAYFTGVNGVQQYKRLLNMARVYPDASGVRTICFPEKAFDPLFYDVFQLRKRLHDAVYQHKSNRAVDFMVQDVLNLASKSLTFYSEKLKKNITIQESIEDMKVYIQLDDTILTLIKHSTSTEKDMIKAKQILKNIQLRNLYYCCGKLPFPKKYIDEKKENIASEVMAQIIAFSNGKLTKDEVIVEVMKVHHGKGRENPLDRISFFKKNSRRAGPLVKEKYGHGVLPQEFLDPSIRLFVKSSDTEKRRVATKCFRLWAKSENQCSPLYSQEPENSSNGNVRKKQKLIEIPLEKQLDF